MCAWTSVKTDRNEPTLLLSTSSAGPACAELISLNSLFGVHLNWKGVVMWKVMFQGIMLCILWFVLVFFPLEL